MTGQKKSLFFPPDLSDEAIQALAPGGMHRQFTRGTTIVRELDDSGALYVIRSGSVKIHVDDEEGREIVISTMRAGDFFGELVIDGGPRSASVTATETTRCFVIQRSDVEKLVLNSPEFAMELIRRLTGKVRTLTTRIVDLSQKNVYARLVQFLNENARDDGPVKHLNEALTQRDIAARIGGSREMVNRILRDLTVGGYIAIQTRQITLLKPLPARW